MQRMTNELRQSSSNAGLRSAALIVAVFGAIGSIGLLRRAPQHPPPLLAVLFIIWVAAPFVLLVLANIFSKRWPAAVQTTLFITTFFITIASLAIYVDNNIARRTAHPAGVWVAVPPAAVVVTGVALVVAAIIARNRKKITGSETS